MGSKRENWDKWKVKRAGMLMILDLDNFKQVNDIYGHSMGDKFLMAFFGNMNEESALASLHHRLND